jgi:hypothetical protein
MSLEDNARAALDSLPEGLLHDVQHPFVETSSQGGLVPDRDGILIILNTPDTDAYRENIEHLLHGAGLNVEVSLESNPPTYGVIR